jgi:hypothetical protein
MGKQKHGNTSHGHKVGGKQSPTYTSWRCMKTRCDDPKSTNYENYGGRGITYCERWEDFENFLSDMGVRPADKTLDRIDNDKGYYKENCRWSTQYEQDCNKRTSKLKPQYIPIIFALYGVGFTQDRIGKIFGVGRRHVSKILNGLRHASSRLNSTQ